MHGNNLRKKLTLRPVGPESLDQFNELLRYVFQVTNKDLQDSGYKEGEIARAKLPVLQHTDVLGWFNGEQLVSQLCIYPCQVNVHGKIFAMAGLTGVGTYPEYANLGLMSELIKVALQKMRQNQQWISYLYPYSIPYYRQKGWEIMNEHITFTLRDNQIPHYRPVPGYVERQEINHPDVIDVYHRFALTHHGAMLRQQLNWDEYWRWENEDERIAAIYYDQQQRPMGYLFYWIAKDVFYIKEMLYLNQEARRGLWNFIQAHLSMIDKVKGHVYSNSPIAFQLDDGHIQECIEPYYMARIVDVAAFLAAYPFNQPSREPLHFIVDDAYAPWNQGIFGLSWDQHGQCQVQRDAAIGQPIKLSIQTLSAMLMSFRRPAYFYRLERLEMAPATLRILEEIIPDAQPYFSDYF